MEVANLEKPETLSDVLEPSPKPTIYQGISQFHLRAGPDAYSNQSIFHPSWNKFPQRPNGNMTSALRFPNAYNQVTKTPQCFPSCTFYT